MDRAVMVLAPLGAGCSVWLATTVRPAACTALAGGQRAVTQSAPSGVASVPRAMEFWILGPLEVHGELGAVALGGIKPRAVLAILLLHANQPVSAERLAIALWGEDAPAGATKAVQVHVSRLRKALGDRQAIVTTPAGYRLRVRPDELDAERFARGVEDGRRALAGGDRQEAGAVVRQALACWRGAPLEEFAWAPF